MDPDGDGKNEEDHDLFVGVEFVKDAKVHVCDNDCRKHEKTVERVRHHGWRRDH